MTRLFLTRHGETEWNKEARMQGWGDSPLTPLGMKQGEWLRDRMIETQIDVIYTSPLGRAYRTAETIRGDRDIKIIESDGLKEIRLGRWEGLSQDEIQKKDMMNYFYFWNEPLKYVPTFNGETFGQVMDRSHNSISDILRKEKGKNILIVTHTVTLKAYLCKLQNREIETIWDPPFIKQTSLTEIEFDEESFKIPVMACMNHHRYTRSEFNEFR